MLELLVPREVANCSDRTESRELLSVGKPTDSASSRNADQFFVEIPKIFVIGFFLWGLLGYILGVEGVGGNY